jgi:predicted SprT family Zn-dependent metalloprotease
MQQKLEYTVPRLCRYFQNSHFEQIRHELLHYHNNVKRHFNAFEHTKIAWAKVMAEIDRIPEAGKSLHL